MRMWKRGNYYTMLLPQDSIYYCLESRPDDLLGLSAIDHHNGGAKRQLSDVSAVCILHQLQVLLSNTCFLRPTSVVDALQAHINWCVKVHQDIRASRALAAFQVAVRQVVKVSKELVVLG
jgi:hypothetical protein